MKKTALFLVLFTLLIFVGSVSYASEQPDAPDFSDYAGKRIGVVMGFVQEKYIQDFIPEAEVVYFNNTADMTIALVQNKIDAFAIGEVAALNFFKENPGYKLDDRSFEISEVAFAFPKTAEGDALKAQMNEFIKTHTPEDNTEIIEKYLKDEDYEFYDFSTLPAVNGKLKLGISVSEPPTGFQTAEGFAGLDCYLLYEFFKEYGYGVDVDITEIPSILAGLSTGVYDIGSSTLVASPERKKNVNFSDPYFLARQSLIVPDPDYRSEKRFFDTVKNGLYRTFIEDNNYKMLHVGLKNTIVITVSSFIFGTILALFIAFLMLRKSALPQRIAAVYHYIFQGLPTVVVLMIIYYVVFAKVVINPTIAAIIGFGLNLASGMAESMYGAVKSVDGGQREAAVALGLTPKQTFTGIIFPQAFNNLLPGFRAETVALLKATAIVGYISVQDFTKMSDIIRSRTYDAFFPLLTTAAGYFIIVYLLRLVFGIIIKYFNSNDRKRQIKGIADEK